MHLLDLKQALHGRQCSHSGRPCFLLLPYSLSQALCGTPMHQSPAAVGPMLLVGKLFEFFSTLTLILSQNFNWNCVLFSKKNPYFSHHRKNVNVNVTWSHLTKMANQATCNNNVLNITSLLSHYCWLTEYKYIYILEMPVFQY